MTTNSIIVELKNTLPEDCWPWVIRALRQEPLVWQALQNDPALFDAALTTCGENAGLWTPANIFKLMIGKETLDLKTKQQAKATYKLFSNSAESNMEIKISIKEAGFAAVAIKLAVEEEEDTQLIGKMLSALPLSTQAPTAACLPGLLADPNSFYNSIFNCHDNPSLQSLGLHACFSNPNSTADRVALCEPILNPLAMDVQVQFIQTVSVYDKLLASELAEHIIKRNNLSDIDKENIHVEDLLIQASLLQLAGQHAKAMPLLNKAWDKSKERQATLTAQLAQHAARDLDTETARVALAQVDVLAKELSTPREDLTFTRFQTGALIDPELNPKEAIHNNPAALLATAQLALRSGDLDQACEAARQALNNLLDQEIIHGIEERDALNSIASILLEVNQPIEAAQATQFAMQLDPTDTNALYIHSRAQAALKAPSEALEHAHMAVALSPNNLNYRTHLKTLLFEQEQWQATISELNVLIDRQQTPPINHFLELATCQLALNQPTVAAQTCQKALSLQPNHSPTLLTLGNAVQQMGDRDSALIHYQASLENDPGLVEAWLALANYYEESNATETAAETLQNALDNVTETAPIYYHMGKLAGSSELALSYFHKAVETLSAATPKPYPLKILHTAAQHLLATHQAEAALQPLHQAQLFDPNNTAILNTLGNVYLSLGKVSEANQTLEQAHNQAPTNIETLILLGKTYLMMTPDDETYIEKALTVITTAQQIDLDNPIPTAMLAQIHLLQNNPEKAFKLFNLALNSDLNKESNWQTDLSIGLAKAACQMNKPEVAITTLLENPEISENIEAQKILCEAYQLAEQPNQAQAKLNAIIELASNNFNDLLWVAEMATTLEIQAIAVNALKQVSKLDPPSPEKQITLAKLWFANDNKELAKQQLIQLNDNPMSSASYYQAAAHLLIEHDDLEASIPLLEKATMLDEWNTESLIHQLTDIYTQVGNYTAALEITNRQLLADPERFDLLRLKANLLGQLNQNAESLAVYYEALELHPDDPSLHYQIAQKEWEQQNFGAALFHAETAYKGQPKEENYAYLAAELNRCCLNFERLQKIIDENPSNDSAKLGWLFLKAENALFKGNDIAATDIIQPLKTITGEHPRLLAIQSRLFTRLNNDVKAVETINQAIEIVSSSNLEELSLGIGVNIELAIAAAAFDRQDWNASLNYTQAALQRMDKLPYAHFMRAKCLVLRAEAYNFAAAVDAKFHSPGEDAISLKNHHAIKKHLADCQQHGDPHLEIAQIEYWHQRADLAFDQITEGLTIGDDLDLQMGLLASKSRNPQHSPQLNLPEFPKANEIENPAFSAHLALYFLAQQPERATEYAERAAKLQSNNPLWLAIAGHTNHSQANWEATVDYYDFALDIWPEENQWHFKLAQAAMELRDAKLSVLHLEHAVKANPEHLPYLMLLGQAYLLDNAPNSAVRVFEKACQLARHLPAVWQNLAQAYAAMGSFEKAENAAERLTRLSPKLPEPIILRAEIALAADDPDKASRFLDTYSKHYASTSKMLNLKSKILVKQNRIEDAIYNLDKAIEMTEEPLAYLLERANLIGERDGKEARLSTLIALAKQTPDDPHVLSALSHAFKENEKYEDAIRAAQNALKKKGDILTEHEVSELHYRTGLYLTKIGQLDQALDHLGKAIESTRNFLDAYLCLGKTHHLRREYNKALEYYQFAITLAPDDARPYFEAGLVLKDTKDYTMAQKMLQRASEIDPNNIDIRRQHVAMMAMNLVHNPT